MKTFALINLKVSVSVDGEIDRETLANTVGTWISLIPSQLREIETTNKEHKAVTITIRVCTDAS